MTNATLQHRAGLLVDKEIHVCVSSLISTLAAGYFTGLPRKSDAGIALDALADRAEELATPILDYESAAQEAGWASSKAHEGRWWRDGASRNAASPEDACLIDGLEPYENEVYEHWAVSPWLAEKLEAKGERIDHDFAGLAVWARTTTGQAIAIDSVIEAIVSETGYASGV